MTMLDPSDVLLSLDRDEIIGSPSHHQISNLGVAQFKHGYDQGLLDHVLRRALALKDEFAEKRQLNLKYIRAAHVLIPEILDVVHSPGRLDRLSRIARTAVEPYPLSVISTIVTFSGPEDADGAIRWHADGVPATELVPLSMDGLEGGHLELYRGPSDAGLAEAARGTDIPANKVTSVPHRMGYSVFGQLMRLMHRVGPISKGSRVTLNMNVRSSERPFIDDNSMCYIAADNPDFAWSEEYVADVRERQLPAYLDLRTR